MGFAILLVQIYFEHVTYVTSYRNIVHHLPGRQRAKNSSRMTNGPIAYCKQSMGRVLCDFVKYGRYRI